MRQHISVVSEDLVREILGRKSSVADRVILAKRQGTFRGNCAQRLLDVTRLYTAKFLDLHEQVDLGCCTDPWECEFARVVKTRMRDGKEKYNKSVQSMARRAIQNREEIPDGGREDPSSGGT